ncbi:MAG: carboxypeptidase regulatory-like domain-containing protein, partial [Bacteroidota bacterium]
SIIIKNCNIYLAAIHITTSVGCEVGHQMCSCWHSSKWTITRPKGPRRRNVTVFDDDAPNVVCKENVAVSLQTDGTVSLPANVFDAGSWDNCELDRLEVSHDDQLYNNTITFDCSHLGMAPVFFRAYDVNGFYRTCEVSVSIADLSKPSIACPSNLNIACTEDPTELALTGLATASDNCSIDSISYIDSLSLNACGVGYILRNWRVVDVAGNTAVCQQYIYVTDQTPLIINYPMDFQSTVCGADISPDITGRPVLSGDDCEDVDVAYEDFVYTNGSNACQSIVREWTIVDRCVYDPNGPDSTGMWTGRQLIELRDEEAPLLYCPTDTVVYHQSLDCTGVFVNVPLPVAEDCNPNVSIMHDSPYAQNAGADASGFYPPGQHLITFTANDGCGNTADCSFVLEVLDGLSPNANCYAALSVTLDENGIGRIEATAVNNSSSDNCTEADSLIFNLLNNTFTCEDLGLQTVTLQVSDEMGNSASCTSLVQVQDPAGACYTSIKGRIVNESGQPMQNVSVLLSGFMQSEQLSDAQGYFEFEDLPKGENYEISASYELAPLNGVSTMDIVLISQHILGFRELENPYQLLAADVNNSGAITAGDLVVIRQLILGVVDRFPLKPSWQLIDAKQSFLNPGDPFGESLNTKLNYNDLQAPVMDADFMGYKIGDVSGDARPD